MIPRMNVFRVPTLLLGVVCLLALTTCSRSCDPAARATDARRSMVAYFECGECNDGQLQRVASLGDYAVPSLSATLKNGPSNASNERMRLHLVEQHRRIVEYRRTHSGPARAPTPDDEPQFVRQFLDNYKARYQIRAATALAAIGTPDARKALEESLQGDRLRSDVRDVVNEALGRRPNPRPAAGPTQDGPRPDQQPPGDPTQSTPRQ
jgi:hypothetical protein